MFPGGIFNGSLHEAFPLSGNHVAWSTTSEARSDFNRKADRCGVVVNRRGSPPQREESRVRRLAFPHGRYQEAASLLRSIADASFLATSNFPAKVLSSSRSDSTFV